MNILLKMLLIGLSKAGLWYCGFGLLILIFIVRYIIEHWEGIWNVLVEMKGLFIYFAIMFVAGGIWHMIFK